MNDEPRDETGEPIDLLADLEMEISSGFLTRVRNKVERRQVTSHFLSMAWHVPAVILLELMNMVYALVGTPDNGKGGSQ